MTLIGQDRSVLAPGKKMLHRELHIVLHSTAQYYVQGLALGDAMSLIGQGESVVAPGVVRSDKRAELYMWVVSDSGIYLCSGLECFWQPGTQSFGLGCCSFGVCVACEAGPKGL
jgi:hypothetical protein